ncbi:MAG: hypothetical protein AAF222_06380 [Pseudomonadota bacterium]
MRYLAFLVLSVFLAASATAAERPITAEEFERIVTGKTFSYAVGGVPYGAEEYLDNRRVRWTFLDGNCSEGNWYPSADQICFIYDTIPDPQCWYFFEQGGQLTARFVGQSEATDLFETSRQSEPLQCLGPEVGV